MFSRDLTLARFDADLFAAMEQEAKRQEDHIELDRKSTRLNSSHMSESRMPSSA